MNKRGIFTGVIILLIVIAIGVTYYFAKKNIQLGPGSVSRFHLECNSQQQCVRVSGGGPNLCTNNSDCAIPPTHLECVGLQCLPVSGAGNDECLTNSDCDFTLINNCGILDIPNERYALSEDILNVVGTCFTISANNITLDGDGFKISGDNLGSDNGVVANVRQGLTIRDLIIENFDTGIKLSSVSSSLIEENIVVNNTLHGIQILSNSDGNNLDNNEVANNLFIGVYLQDSSDNNVRQNLIRENNDGIVTFSFSFNNEFLGNNVTNNSNNGFWIRSEENTLEDNIASNNIGSGISLGGATNSIVINNIANENGNSGIRLESSSNSLILNNIVNNNNFIGIAFASGQSHGTKVNNNQVNGNGDVGIRIFGGLNDIKQNNVNGNSRGILITPENGTNFIFNNSVEDNQEGISVNSDSNVLEGNLVINNSGQGIRLDTSDAFNNVLLTNIISNSGQGISLLFSSDNLIENNEIINNNNGIIINSSNNNTIKNTVVKNSNQDAIRLTYASLPSSFGNKFINVQVSGTPLDFYDINFLRDGTYGTRIVDSSFNRYYFGLPTSASFFNGTIIEYENTVFGVIKFLSPLTGAGKNLTREIIIGNNSAFLRHDTNPGLNRSALITLRGFPGAGISNPRILRDGNPCPTSICFNLTALNIENVLFNVTGWTEYSIG